MAIVWLVERLGGIQGYISDEQFELERKKGNYLKKIKKLFL